MRALFSYGLAFLILLLAGGWLATGTLVVGGNGPGMGETPIISLIEGEPHGPLSQTLDDAGILAQHGQGEDEVDPRLTIAQRNEAAREGDTSARSVRTTLYEVQPMPIIVPLRGQTSARATVNAVAETSGIVETVHVSKGQRVEAGDMLCTLDQGTRRAAVAQAEAQVAQAEASLEQAQLDFETNQRLRERGLTPENTANSARVAVTAAEASLSSAQVGLDNARTELENTEITAEVGGLVQEPLANLGEMLSMGTPCAAIVQLDPMLFTGRVPEAHIALARTGLEATIRTVTNQTAKGKVTYVSATAEPATRSFAVEIEFPNEDGNIRDGVTAEATIDVGTAPGHLLPQSVLTLDDDGTLGVRTVEDGVVAFHEVQVVRDTRDGVWVTGLPAEAEIITLGQEYVTTGQAVDATRTDGSDLEAEPQSEAEASV
ncbi:hemolysin D [Devosia pacifica]|uniref:Hemolysin D n=1 Tax=Devosia pacifica TaxID=1335967 RepID=A0A918SBL8_9HYPH|nr:efflux RND transporter periplasmic adaptor subunit [Devosia pacifica]GHA34364.1 hemolysin D [Devosia pacifica]